MMSKKIMVPIVMISIILLHSTHCFSFDSEAMEVQLPFISIEKQVNENVLFCANLDRGTAFIQRDGEIVYSLPGTDNANKQCVVLKEEFLNACIADIHGSLPANVHINRFIGDDASNWESDIPSFHLIDYGEIYNNIRLTLRRTNNSVEKLFLVAPGGNSDEIRIKLHGIQSLRIDPNGELVAASKNFAAETGKHAAEMRTGEIRFTKPVAFQETDNGRRSVPVEYVTGGIEYGFKVGDYDRGRPLFIDPLLSSTFLGGGGTDGDFSGPEIVLDAEGNIYIVSTTESLDLPTTPGAYEEEYQGGTDFFVAKMSSDLKKLLVCTFIGGSGLEKTPNIRMSPQGEVFVTGYTSSPDFPTTAGAYDETYNGGDKDYFVLKLSPDLTTLQASTYLGGSDAEGPYGSAIAIDDQGDLFVAGGTLSADFPVTAGAYDQIYNGENDIFFARLDNDLSTLYAATYLGGSEFEVPTEAVPDNMGNVYLSGSTLSTDFPITPGAYDNTYNGGLRDICISRFDRDLTTLQISTYLGGNNPGEDSSCCLVPDDNGDLLLTGHAGAGFPTTPGAYDRTHNNHVEGYIAKISADLSTLLASTFMSGTTSCGNIGFDLVLGTDHTIYVCGTADGSGFPTLPHAYDRTFNGGGDDVLVVRYASDLSEQLCATYLGGNQLDVAYYILLDENDDLILSGITASDSFPTTLDAYDEEYNGGDYDLFIARFDPDLSADPLALSKNQISSTQGGAIVFTLDAGEPNAGRTFLILGSLSGYEPGHTLPGGHALLPLNWDAFTDSLLLLVNSHVLMKFMGTLNASGTSMSFLMSGPIDPGFIGLEMYYAYCLNEPFDFASNPVAIEIVP